MSTGEEISNQNFAKPDTETSNMADILNTHKDNMLNVPLVFLKESAFFGDRKPTPLEWIKHVDLYHAIGNRIDAGHITGLQRIRGMWRIYLDNLEDKVILMAEGIPLRGKIVPVLSTNPDRLDGENTIKVRIKNVPLSVEDGVFTRALTLKNIEVISIYREKLRVNNKLTNCETGDRILIVKASSLKVPLPHFMSFGKFTGRVLHFGQTKQDDKRPKKCSKCLQNGHVFSECTNDWVCTICNNSGHKREACGKEETSDSEQDYESDSDATVSNTEKSSIDGKDDAEDVEATSSNTWPTSSPKSSRGEQTIKPGNPVKHPNTQKDAYGQESIDKYFTPNKGRQKNVTERSPPTPAEELHDRQNKEKRKNSKKKKH